LINVTARRILRSAYAVGIDKWGPAPRQVTWQSNWSRCGPAALANAYRSLGETATTEEKVLTGTGAVLDRLLYPRSYLGRAGRCCAGNTSRKITVFRDLSEQDFLEHLRRSNDLARCYIVNFSRHRIFGAGVGHHSPIGGYLETEDLVFILDGNREYQSWRVEHPSVRRRKCAGRR
jgi:hypothetical protein